MLEGTLKKCASIYPECYHVPTIKEALAETGLCKEDMKCAVKEGTCSKALPKEDVAAAVVAVVALCTHDFGPGSYESSTYRTINKALMGEEG